MNATNATRSYPSTAAERIEASAATTNAISVATSRNQM